MGLKSIESIIELMVDVPDFPKPGILFKDITPVLGNHEAFVSLARQFYRSLEKPEEVSKIVAIEARGFILGAALAQHINAGLVLVRKPGKLPRERLSHTYDLEYGTDTLEIHKEDISPGDKVIIIDDVLATGGTAKATCDMCKKLGAEILGLHVLLEIEALKGREKIDVPLHVLAKC
ncbi:MAG: adenine phosphoribosyltransferase [Bdellovibrionaceae bacterium]|jgi:adenine phosphoribosyltransferase|nr:adenine phosphoribosyltransferase [Pseudobdellovibrionaceae bacterium]